MPLYRDIALVERNLTRSPQIGKENAPPRVGSRAMSEDPVAADGPDPLDEDEDVEEPSGKLPQPLSKSAPVRRAWQWVGFRASADVEAFSTGNKAQQTKAPKAPAKGSKSNLPPKFTAKGKATPGVLVASRPQQTSEEAEEEEQDVRPVKSGGRPQAVKRVPAEDQDEEEDGLPERDHRLLSANVAELEKQLAAVGRSSYPVFSRLMCVRRHSVKGNGSTRTGRARRYQQALRTAV